ncbi:MAG: hypothetical protein KF866_12845 [Phycisphaeraceae bacterium]|nr:hypothetical protein [Phycisphaeraceae bacterium]MCW5754145.1 hypothetical protein [Phycisphaeraceae bacterium]
MIRRIRTISALLSTLVVATGCVETSRKERTTTGTLGLSPLPRNATLKPRSAERSYVNPPKLGGLWEQDYENRQLRRRLMEQDK